MCATSGLALRHPQIERSANGQKRPFAAPPSNVRFPAIPDAELSGVFPSKADDERLQIVGQPDLSGSGVGSVIFPAENAPNRTQAKDPAERPFGLTCWISLLKGWCRLTDSNR